MEKCSSRGDALNNWTNGCEHLGSPSNTSTINTARVTASDSEPLWDSAPVVNTSKGLGVSTNGYNDLFGDNAYGLDSTRGSSTSSSTSGAISPVTGSLDNDVKLNSWSPDPSSTLRPLGETDIITSDATGSDNLKLSGADALKTSGAVEKPSTPTPPSTRPYIWKDS